ncbi:D-2-hydroxyacid dehydrogenase [Microlunatus flavus]|uniref:Phosphoglycerate dehydrogenase n=1 Tax=Microlunatus flavus TaxID=1036181 RepID=A0A1H9H037_9ACTN|nr:D-2-hydroxyacid dehydrogenase [Microlunatus flavus]SEQ55685.1 Phosphoglycerate dehydrogenase [Microlunatus flavus]
MPGTTTVLIASPLEPELVERVAAAVPDVDVLFEPALLPVPRYPCEHGGTKPDLDASQSRRWSELLASAEVTFDFDWRDPAATATNAPRLRWVQATSAGIGGFVARTGLDRTGITFTTAAGVHAVPLAEFALTGVLDLAKGVPHLRAQQAAHRWERYATSSVRGRRAVVVGLGSIGRETVRLLDAVGLDVTGVGRPGRTYDVPGAARLVSTDDLDAVLPGAEVLVLATPLTEETQGLVSGARIASLPQGAIVVNVARGQVVDEAALTEALTSGHLGGAALDVFEVEPLPEASPLWDLPNVIVSPHSASTLVSENAAIVDLFVDNLRRFLDGRPLRNTYDATRGY